MLQISHITHHLIDQRRVTQSVDGKLADSKVNGSGNVAAILHVNTPGNPPPA